MDEDWKNAFGILMCTEICDGTGAGICNGSPSTCSDFIYNCIFCVLSTKQDKPKVHGDL